MGRPIVIRARAYLEHGDSLVQHRLVVLASAREGLDAPVSRERSSASHTMLSGQMGSPERAETERALLAADAVVRL